MSTSMNREQDTKKLNEAIQRILVYNFHKRIAVSTMEGVEFICVNDIIRCEAMERCTQFFLVEGKKIISSQNLGHFKTILLNYHFFQTHRSHLVNLQYIVRYSKEGVVTLSNGEQVPISRRNKDKLLQQFR